MRINDALVISWHALVVHECRISATCVFSWKGLTNVPDRLTNAQKEDISTGETLRKISQNTLVNALVQH